MSDFAVAFGYALMARKQLEDLHNEGIDVHYHNYCNTCQLDLRGVGIVGLIEHQHHDLTNIRDIEYEEVKPKELNQ